MSMQASPRRSAHIVVLGNEKSGSGKSTTVMHVAVALMHIGQRVATIDLDYIENRRRGAKRARADLPIPVHHRLARGSRLRLDENEAIEFAGFAEAVTAVERARDFIVVDSAKNEPLDLHDILED